MKIELTKCQEKRIATTFLTKINKEEFDIYIKSIHRKRVDLKRGTSNRRAVPDYKICRCCGRKLSKTNFYKSTSISCLESLSTYCTECNRGISFGRSTKIQRSYMWKTYNINHSPYFNEKGKVHSKYKYIPPLTN